jgi:flagellar basal-body rod protein FlgB
MSGLLNDPTLDVMRRALGGLAHRENAIATNLANIDTPGYRPVSVDFESALRDAATSASAAGLTSPAGIATASSSAARAGIPRADEAMYRTDPRHFNAAGGTDAGLPDTVQSFSGSGRNDGNSVDLESEMAALVETQIRFGAVSRLATAKIAGLREVITGRG